MRILLFIVAGLLIVISIILVVACIQMKIEYWGENMGNEAGGFYSLFLALAVIFTLPAIMLWVYLLRRLRSGKK
jgi:uncharacterized membrane protein